MGTRIYVGNLPFSATEEQLRSVFAEAGEVVEVSIATDRLDGRPRGFAFVQMAAIEDAASAIARLDGTRVDGRTLKVNLAEDRAGAGGAERASRFGADKPPQRSRAKGSRRNVRSRRRGF